MGTSGSKKPGNDAPPDKPDRRAGGDRRVGNWEHWRVPELLREVEERDRPGRRHTDRPDKAEG